MSITTEVRNDLLSLVVGAFQAAPGTTLLNSLADQYIAKPNLAAIALTMQGTAEFIAAYPRFLSNQEFAARVVDNILEGRVTAAERQWAIDTMVADLNKGAGRAELILSAVIELQKTTNPAWANAKNAFINQVEVAKFHTVDLGKDGTLAERKAIIADVDQTASSVTTAKAVVNAPVIKTFALTAGLDTGSAFTGVGNSNDTFVSVDNGNATTGTLTAGDNLTGGQGDDTLLIVASGTPSSPLVSTSGIENLEITNNSNANYAVNASLMSGLTTVKVTGGASSTSVTNSLANLNVSASNTNFDIVTTSATPSTGAADAIGVTLNGVGTITNTSITSNGIETMNVSLAGTASGSTRVGAERTVTLVSNELETVNVTGTAAANLVVSLVGANLLGQVGTVNAAAATGNVTISVTPGASADKKTLVSMGSGNDKVTIGALDKDYTITGGTGTDTLVATAGATTGLAAAAYVGVGVSGFEIIEAAGAGTVDFRSIANNTTFVATTGAGTYTAAGAGIADSFLTATTGTLTLTRATNGTADALNVHIQSDTAATVSASVVNEETVTIASAGAGVVTHNLTLTVADATKLNIIGTNALNLGALVGETKLAAIDAGAHKGSALTVDATDSTVAMTVTGSAGSEATIGGTVNTITTGSGADKVTGGAFRDVITTGLGNDSVDGGAGNDTINTGGGNDTVIGGAGDDVINAGTGDDSIDGGEGNDSIDAGSGTDTVLGGAGDDRIVVTLSDNTNVDGGTGTDRVSASTATITPTTATSVSGQFIAVSESVAPTLANVEGLWVRVDADAGAAATSAVNLDLTKATSLTTLHMDTDDADSNSFMRVTNFAGSSIFMYGTGFGSGAEANAIILDGVGQSALTLNLQAFGQAATSTLGFTGVQGLTIAGASKSQLTGSADQQNALGVVTANAVTSLTVSSSGSSAANADALKVASISATAANTVTLSVGAFDEMAIDTVTAGTVVETVTLTTGTDSIVDINAINLSTSAVVRADITLGAGAKMSLDGTIDTAKQVDLSATSIADFNVTLGAGAQAALDLSSIAMTDADFSIDSSSRLILGTSLGRTGAASDFVFTGRGDLDSDAAGGAGLANTFNLLGTTVVFNSSGLSVDADDLAITSAATLGATITTGLGNDAISGGAGNDVLNGGVGNDRFGLTGRTETFTVTQADPADTYIVTINGVAAAQQTVAVAAGATNDNAHKAALATQLAAAINATSATSFATAVANAAVVTVTYAQNFGTTGSIAVTEVGGGTISAVGVAVTAAGDNAGNDTIIGGLGADTIIGGTGADGLSGGTGANDIFMFRAGDTALTIAGTGNDGTITGFDVITDFALGTAAANAETLEFLGVTEAALANTAGADGVNSTLTIGGATIKSHAVTNGIVTFDDLDTFATAVPLVTTADLAAVVQYLQAQDLGNAGVTVAFVVGTNTFVYMQGDNDGTNALDILIQLTGVVGTSITATNATTAGLIDIGA